MANRWSEGQVARARCWRSGLLLLVLLSAFSPASSDAGDLPTAAARANGGAVASAAPAATEAGILTLRAGGNAVDAAVATALALAVVHPVAGNLGGGGFAVVKVGSELAALDFRETAPAAATPMMFLDASGNPVDERSLIGPLAAGVPGSPTGLWELQHRYGVLPWAHVVEPARRLAADGFTVTSRFAREIEHERALLARFAETTALLLPGGKPPAVGSTIRFPKLAAALAEYARKGPTALTTGSSAQAIERSSRRYGGILTAADVAGYQPVWRTPIQFEAFGWHVAAMPLPSSGGIILAQTCAILERMRWQALPRTGADAPHLLAETWRRAYADRLLLGDTSTTLAGPTELLDPQWLAARADEIDRKRATPSTLVKPWARTARREREETTHLSVVDAAGNAVALTTTLNGGFGCGVLVPELEILLNNEMDDFATAPGKPNQYGLIQGDANAVGAGKRMLSSMTPTVAWRDGEMLSLGSPGGSTIPTATAQVFLALVAHHDALQQAVDRPRLHHQRLPDQILLERNTLSAETATALTQRGHRLQQVEKLGEVHAARRLPDGSCEAAADPRGPGSAQVTTPPLQPSPAPTPR
jgi:gamma-glutamyltranspeptidase/glutathione hydrolase